MTTIKVDKFRRFGFTNTAYITGNFDSLSLYKKSLIKDSNLKFNTDNFKISTLDDMFNGCINASFTHSLSIGADCSVISAKRMFNGCEHASLPSVDIGSSNLKYCDYMFNGCSNAIMEGASFPYGAISVVGMFNGCKRAVFDDITKINNSASDYSNAFYGCTNGNFRNLHMPSDNKIDSYNMQYMFYGCSCFDADNLYLENISDSIRVSDYMFYGAGTNGAESLDDSVVKFKKLESCTSMFDSSNFSFSNSFFQFFKNGEIKDGIKVSNKVKSIKRMFYNTGYVLDSSPVIVLGNMDEDNYDDMNNRISNAFSGHYSLSGSDVVNGITDFSEAFTYSSAKIADLRGISNNTDLDQLMIYSNYDGKQNFTSMFSGCTKLESVKGHIPPFGYTYKNMFKGCSSLKFDISTAFKKHSIGWSGNDEYLTSEGLNGNTFKTYHMTSIAGMFGGCDGIYSSNDDFDLVSLIKTVHNNYNYYVSKGAIKSSSITEKDCMNGAFSKLRIATGNAIPGLELVNYDMDDISSKCGIVRYNSFNTDFYEVSGGEISEFGVNSEYMKFVFTSGFYRYGGRFKDNPNKMFFIIENPIKDDSSGDVTGFSNQKLGYTPNAVPRGFSDRYNANRENGFWNEYTFDKLYAAKIYDVLKGEFIENAFVGPYTRTYKLNRISDGKLITLSTDYQMPVTIFDIYSDEADIID